MKQLVQNLKSGEMRLLEVPAPALQPGNVLVRVHYSLISAGTEGAKVSTARKGYLGKAKEKPEQVKQVVDTLRKEGIRNTYRKVMNKLDAWAPLGYSCAGTVLETGKDVKGFQTGDRVACAGQDIANHAEVVSVPVNLCVKVPDAVPPEAAAYNTLGAIALQGIRQADLRLGESCAVIGLGLLGQLTVQMLKASGVRAFGIDVNPAMVEKARQSGADLALTRDREGLEETIRQACSGEGVDAVIITAGTSSLDPVELAGALARQKGRVIVVGAVPTGFSRTNYYQKELELRMSCSYGPGRYDPDYEEKGIDYPYGYVRWTENRNMQAFQELIRQHKLNFDHLTTHVFDIDQAPQAYEIILKKSEPFLGMLLKFQPDRPLERTISLNGTYKPTGKVRVGFIGAGSFAQTYLLPALKSLAEVDLVAVANASGHNARTVADRYGFAQAGTDDRAVAEHADANTVFIATRHHLHARQVIAALEAGKHVFVEKPLAMTPAELDAVGEAYRKARRTGEPAPLLMVGFNRRFAPHIQAIKEKLSGGPLAINYRINAGAIPANHWSQDAQTGGGRIIGEVCHFIDLARYLAGSPIRAQSAQAMDDPQHLNDTLVINLKFENGSVATISYFANGGKRLAKEYLEVFSGGMTAVLDDFRELRIYGTKVRRQRSATQDKGHAAEVKAFVHAVAEGRPAPISIEELEEVSRLTFAVEKAVRSGKG